MFSTQRNSIGAAKTRVKPVKTLSMLHVHVCHMFTNFPSFGMSEKMNAELERNPLALSPGLGSVTRGVCPLFWTYRWKPKTSEMKMCGCSYDIENSLH